MLALRNPLDTNLVATNGVRTGGLFGQAPPAPKPVMPRAKAAPVKAEPAPASVPAPKPYVVEAFRGQKRSEEIVK